MKINLNKPIQSLDGKDIPDVSMGQFLAENVLCKSTPGIESMKAMDWARSFYKNEDLEIDRTDLSKLVSLVEGNSDVFNLVKSQIVEELKKAEETKK